MGLGANPAGGVGKMSWFIFLDSTNQNLRPAPLTRLWSRRAAPTRVRGILTGRVHFANMKHWREPHRNNGYKMLRTGVPGWLSR